MDDPNDGVLLSQLFARQATLDDLKQILLLMLCREPKLNRDEICAYLDEVLRGDQKKLFVLSNEAGDVYAQCTLFIEKKLTHSLKSVGHIEDLIVYDEKLKNELESMLLLEVRYKALQADCYKVVVSCDDENMSRFEQLGFRFSKQIMGVYFERAV